jgi:uncharacterized membrane protein YkoI
MKKTKLVALACTLAVPMALFLAGCGAQPAQSTDANANKESTQTTQTTDNKSQTNTQSTTQTQTQTPAQTTPAQPTYIGEEAAKKAALSHAGFDESAVTNLKVELDTDDGTVHYDVDFKQGGMEYDYDINATTGEIMKSKSEVDD